MNAPYIMLTETDYDRLNSLLELNNHVFKRDKPIEDLENEIGRARVVKLQEVPADLVTMNTRFTYLNVNENKECEMTIVYPHQSDIGKRWVSVTAPLGAALIGLREGNEIEWSFPDGKTRTLRILKVLHQPEADILT